MIACEGGDRDSGAAQAQAQMGSFQSSGFELSYLEKVSEVKDTVRRQPLLHHLCALVLQARPDSSDLYSEIPALARCAKVSTRPLLRNPCPGPLRQGQHPTGLTKAGHGARGTASLPPPEWAAGPGLAQVPGLCVGSVLCQKHSSLSLATPTQFWVCLAATYPRKGLPWWLTW